MLRMISSSTRIFNPTTQHRRFLLSIKPPSQIPNFFGHCSYRFTHPKFSPSKMTFLKCFSVSHDPVPISGTTELNQSTLVVVSFYKFADFLDHANMRKPLKELCEELRVSGGIILAPEGINGSICGTRESVEKVLEFIKSDDRLKGLRQVESPVSAEEEALHHGHSTSSPLAAGEDAPFRWDHVRVKLKKEIVTLGMPTVSPIERVGKYVNPKEWNELISDPDTMVIDVRNSYETRIGKFKGAIDPCTISFREFPDWVENQFVLADTDKVNHGGGNGDKAIESPKAKVPERVAMYCTGGIRCEKASSLLLSKGFKEVYHLEGGILKYLEEVPPSESSWEVSDADMEAPEWEYGVSCPHCYSSKSDEEKERARARQRQFETWGIIGGPDKGRRPTSKPDSTTRNSNQLSSSI
ncbi:hypothetical protein JCGZ_03307 [Jatropha curcas]|uniref:Rhodanese domain-containing protein n=1 Tax=Jatropha curcas TaxID=180498 RepID=A0A067JCS7_JATCU|nr:hypothetical protein JCGZ_03307 [Jatropha curcas]